MKAQRWTRRLRRALAGWWECRTRRCSYYAHYQVYGPCELTHAGWHHAERLGGQHFADCRHPGGCRVCLDWERRLRA